MRYTGHIQLQSLKILKLEQQTSSPVEIVTENAKKNIIIRKSEIFEKKIKTHESNSQVHYYTCMTSIHCKYLFIDSILFNCMQVNRESICSDNSLYNCNFKYVESFHFIEFTSSLLLYMCFLLTQMRFICQYMLYQK